MTVARILDHYLANFRGKSKHKIFLQTRNVVRLIGSIPANDLRGYQLTEYRTSRLSEGVSDVSVNRELAYLRAAFNRALEEEMIERVPKFRMAKENPAREGFVAYPKLLEIMKFLPDEVAEFVHFLFLTGWRKSAAAGLVWPDIDFENHLIHLHGQLTKNDQPILFPLAGKVAEVIEERRNKRNHLPFVFLRKGRQLKDIRKAWHKATKWAGVPELLIHDLRRSNAIWHIRAGIPRKVTMELAGWRTESIYQRYVIVNTEMLIENVKKAEEFLRRTIPPSP